jgi:hypothetical protein
MVPRNDGDGAAMSSGTSLARCHLGIPDRHTSVVGGNTPLASAVRSSSIGTTRCTPSESAQRHFSPLPANGHLSCEGYLASAR